MNIDKYKKIRLYLMLLGILFFPIALFIPRKKNRIIFCSTNNLKYNYNSKYLFEYFIKKYPELEIKYVLNDLLLKKKLENELGDYFIDTFSLKNIIYCLKAQIWITSTLETPVGGMFLNYRRIVIHLGHGVPLKNIGLLEKNITFLKKFYYKIIKYNFSYFLSTSNEFIKIWSNFMGVSEKKIIVSGQPRNDSIFKNQNNFLKNYFDLKEDEVNILYAPTWRQWSETKLFPFEDFDSYQLEKFLIKNKVNIFLRVHPDFENKIENDLLNRKGIYQFDNKMVEDITEYLSCFDMLITDYSSIFADFLLLDRPILFFPYDYEEYENKIGFTVNYGNHTPGEKIYNFKDFLIQLENIMQGNDKSQKIRKELNNFYNSCKRDINCKLVSNFILEKIKDRS